LLKRSNTVKSLEELKALREKMQKQMNVRDAGDDTVRILVGMATCGIAAGARPVMQAFLEEVNKRNLKNVIVQQTGCIGVCRLEPIAEVFVPGEEKVTYVKLKPEMVPRIINDHIVNRNIVSDYTIGAAE
jgi:NADP-reducing hydrogenase subunit HndB